jgi:hypothetical protein
MAGVLSLSLDMENVSQGVFVKIILEKGQNETFTHFPTPKPKPKFIGPPIFEVFILKVPKLLH